MASAAGPAIPNTTPMNRQGGLPYLFSAPNSPVINTRPRPAGITAAPVAASAPNVPTFKAPAHKHAHHLHSIPRREKSTRTLILDYMLWVHTRTRLQQARSELGMYVSGDAASDIGGSPESAISLMDIDREISNEDEDQGSDGEDVLKIKFGAKDQERNMRSPVEDQHEERQNLPLAHILRLRADGVEKVLIAMLDQPPEVQPPYSDEDTTPRTAPAIHGDGEHYFPNGVRLRLSLGTLVNDLFSRDTALPLSPRSSNTPAYQARNAQTPASTPQVKPESENKSSPTSLALPSSVLAGKGRTDEMLENGLPACLLPLARISSFSFETDRNVGNAPSLPSFSSFARSNSSSATDTLPPIVSSGSTSLQSTLPRRATGRALTLYNAGTDPTTANSPPSLRCPRHLHHTCKICAPAQMPASIAGTGPSLYAFGTSPRSPYQTRAGISLGSSGKSKMSSGPVATGLASWKSGAGIGAGLVGPGIEGTVLRRRKIIYHTTSHPTAKDVGLCSVGGQLAELIPRFLRLSALVAVELGREAKDQEDEAQQVGDKRLGSPAGRESDDDQYREEDAASSGATGQAKAGSALKSSDVVSPFLLSLSFQPTKEWYGILAGLLTRAALEGYLSHGWKGPLGMECILGVGLGIGPRIPNAKEPEEDEFAHLDPDDCPSLQEAAKILFPNLCRQMKAEGPEVAYETEMLERISEFLTIPESTPDLSTHYEDLAYKFPTEPIERAIVRFCEAVARWRGLPELGNYKKASKAVEKGHKHRTSSIDSLINVNSASGQKQSAEGPRRPTIEKYFMKGPSASSGTSKRRRSVISKPSSTEGRQKRPHFEATDDWTGPYGI